MYKNTFEEFGLSRSEDKNDEATLLNNNPNLVHPAEHLRLLRTENGNLRKDKDGRNSINIMRRGKGQ
jgi:hypothetical protein